MVDIVDLLIVRASPDVGPAEIETFPAVDAAVIDVRFTCPVPDTVTFPVAVRFPVNVTVVPPLIETAPFVADNEPDPEYVTEGFMSMLPADAFPAMLRFPPVTVSAPVEEILGDKLMFVVVVARPIVIELGATGN